MQDHEQRARAVDVDVLILFKLALCWLGVLMTRMMMSIAFCVSTKGLQHNATHWNTL